jgi:hypothetical protein
MAAGRIASCVTLPASGVRGLPDLVDWPGKRTVCDGSGRRSRLCLGRRLGLGRFPLVVPLLRRLFDTATRWLMPRRSSALGLVLRGSLVRTVTLGLTGLALVRLQFPVTAEERVSF